MNQVQSICIMYTHMGMSIIRGIIRQSIYQIYIFRPKGGRGGDYSTLLFSFSGAWVAIAGQCIASKTKENRTADPDLKGTVLRDFSLQEFYMNHLPPKPLIIPIASFRIFPQIRGNIHSSKCTAPGVVDTGGKRKISSIRKVFNILFFLRSL